MKNLYLPFIAVAFLLTTAQLQAQQNGNDMPPLFFEFLKGYLRTWLPEIEGDTLIFSVEGQQGGDWDY